MFPSRKLCNSPIRPRHQAQESSCSIFFPPLFLSLSSSPSPGQAFPPQMGRKRTSKRSRSPRGSPSPKILDDSLTAFFTKIDQIKQRWDEANKGASCQTEFGTEWSTREWADDFKAMFEKVEWDTQTREWRSLAMRFVNRVWEKQDIYNDDFVRRRFRLKVCQVELRIPSEAAVVGAFRSLSRSWQAIIGPSTES